jgi:hypothetical protein
MLGAGDVYNDLLNAAQGVKPQKAIFRGKTVIILEPEGVNFSRVYYEGDSPDTSFSIPNVKLKFQK